MNQQRTTFILLAILIAFAAVYWLWIKDKKTTSLNSAESQFSVNDTASITEVELVKLQNDQESGKVLLRRAGKGQWTVNNRYKAQTQTVQTLLTTLFRLEAREPVHPNARQTIFEAIKRSHIRVQVVTGSKTYRYYVSGSSPDGSGTIMMQEGADFPYIVELPGFQGYLTSRFIADVDAWRENLLFDINPQAITQITVKTPSPDSSFKLKKTAAHWLINNKPADSTAVTAYLDRYGAVYGESFAGSFCPNCYDSLKTAAPTYSMDIQLDDNKTTQLKLYDRGPEASSFLGIVSTSDEVRTVQKFVIQRYFVSPQFFEHSKTTRQPLWKT